MSTDTLKDTRFIQKTMDLYRYKKYCVNICLELKPKILIEMI